MHAFVIAISNYNYLTFIHALFLEEEKFALMSFEIKNEHFVHRIQSTNTYNLLVH